MVPLEPNGITSGTIGRTFNDIGIPLVPLIEPWTYAMWTFEDSRVRWREKIEQIALFLFNWIIIILLHLIIDDYRGKWKWP